MANKPSSDEMRRLEFIKYQYEMAVAQSKQPEPFSHVSLLTFHDAIESFLNLIMEHQQIQIKKDIKFPEYWEYADKNEIMLGSKAELIRLNNARVSLKHYGNRPNKTDIDDFKVDVKSFLENNSKALFDIDFSSISLSDLILDKEARDTIKLAEDELNKNDIRNALDHIGIAYGQLLLNFNMNMKKRWGHSPYTFYTHFDSFYRPLKSSEQFVNNVESSIEALEEAMRVISIGMDYLKYICCVELG